MSGHIWRSDKSRLIRCSGCKELYSKQRDNEPCPDRAARKWQAAQDARYEATLRDFIEAYS
jgi:hypothetical protein